MDAAAQRPAVLDEARAFRWFLYAAGAVGIVLVLCAAAVAVKLPFGEWDAMAYSIWSRQIALHWPHFEFAGVPAVDLHRPVFYYLEGTLWAIFGFHQALGRFLALAFGVLLAAALTLTAARTSPRRYGAAAGATVLALLIASYPYERYLVSGLTDVPVAAMITLTAAMLAAACERPRLVPLVALAACLALLTKPTALASLLGLGAAILLGDRAGLRRRAYAVTAVAAGMFVALVYDAYEAHRLHMSTWGFLTMGTDGFYAALAATRRRQELLDQAWLGSNLRLLVIFGVVYAVVRLAMRHRIALAAALPLALVWSIAGPRLAGEASGIVSGSGGAIQSVIVLVLAAALLFALASPDEAVAGRLELGRLLVWLTPPLLVWIVYSAYDIRLLGAAWPPLLLLVGRALLPAVAGAATVGLSGLAATAATVLAVAAAGTLDLNGFGRDGWHRFSSGFGDRDALRSLALGGDFNAELAALEPLLPTTRTIVTADARLQFYYLERVRLEPPTACGQLNGEGTTLVLLESDEERTLYGDKASSAFWEACRKPKATLVADRPGAFALFVAGARGRTALGSCSTDPTAGLSVEFGRFRSVAAAKTLLARSKGAGFVQARVEQLACELYRVVETGIPSAAVGRSIVDEAAKAHLRARVIAIPAASG
jgi:hypothetical protein